MLKQLVKLSVKEAMKPPNERKIVLRFNSKLQPVGDEASILSGILRLLGSDYTKFSICERTGERFTPGTRLWSNYQAYNIKNAKKDLEGNQEQTELLKKILNTAHRKLLRMIRDGTSIIVIVKR
ncbi:hypothetical protein Ahy_A09g044457 isoform B [Arachis hypogaea]|uniref:Uncharacterized protein n=1 Tax=Arachis hypogaea TaxID=3818 RepID=A0A445BK52_ARAHY|nr:hypothetical protein Ahy_A09g044457 isoform B [Arachis hypogaea]